MRARALAALVPLALALLAAEPALAAGPPLVAETWVTDVTATSANLRAVVDPEGVSATYRLEYLTEGAYEANVAAAREGFAGAALAPASGAAPLGSGTTAIAVAQHVGPLAPETSYRYRVRATSTAGTGYGEERLLTTAAPTNVFPPIDGRAREMVSPVEKDGGSVGAPESIFGGGDFQAATGGDAFTFSSASSFGAAAGAPPASQYLSTRGAAGWTTRNVSAPLESGGYGDRPDGVPFRVFSADLARALMLDPRRCEGEPCPRGYSLRDTASGAMTPLPAEAAGMRVLGVSSDLGHILLEDEGGEVWEWGGGGLTPGEAPVEPEPVAGIVGVLGASASGEIVYFQDSEGLERWRDGVVTTIVAGADAAAPSDWPAATGTARVTPDGEHLAFLSAARIPPFDNTDADTGEPDTELYVYGPPPGGGAPRLLCASCDPTGERPSGSASIPGTVRNGSAALYRPRVLAAGGNRVFFDTADRLVVPDTDSATDVYEWEAAGVGDCTRSPGCVGLISGGRGEGGTFLDASESGDDAFFLTGESLVGADPGQVDVYDDRVGGGLPEPEAPFACEGDACQALPSPPEDPTPATLVPTAGNPPLKVEKLKERRRCPRGKVRRNGFCQRRLHRHPRRGRHGHRGHSRHHHTKKRSHR